MTRETHQRASHDLLSCAVAIVQFRIHQNPLDKKTKDTFIQGYPQSEVKYSQIPVRR